MPQLLVFAPLYPPHVGGLQSHAAEFNRHVARAGYTITVFTPLLTTATVAYEQTEPGVIVYRFPAWEIIPNYPLPQLWRPAFWRQWRQVTARRPDIVISRTRFFVTSLLAGLYAKRWRVPWLHIEHGSDFVHLNNIIARLCARLYDEVCGRLVLRLADTVVANSQASAAFVRRLVPRRQVTVIYRGVEREAMAAVQPARDARTEAGAATVITYVGRLIDGKGVADLIEACRTLTGTDFRLWIIGDGPERKRLEQQAARRGLTSQVRFFGETAWPNTIALVKVSDIVVNPSYTEGLPTSVIEAAWCGRAIIATDVGGTDEIIQHDYSGYLFTPRDLVRLRRLLRDLIEHPAQRARLGEHAYKSVQGKFDWRHATASYCQLFIDIVRT